MLCVHAVCVDAFMRSVCVYVHACGVCVDVYMRGVCVHACGVYLHVCVCLYVLQYINTMILDLGDRRH